MPCKKRKFSSRREAVEVLNYIYQNGSRNTAPIRPYWCKICGNFHLTSQIKEEEKKRKKKTKKTSAKPFSNGYLESWQKRKKF